MFNKIVDRTSQGSLKWLLSEGITKDTVPFSVADVDFAHPKELKMKLKEYIDEMVFGYTIISESYYDSVINWFQTRHDWNVSREEILVLPGVMPAIANSVKAFSNELDGVIIMTPVYTPFKRVVENLNRTVVDVPLIEENNFYTMDFELLDQKMSDSNTKLLIFCSPHNPVGRVWTEDELLRLANLSEKHNILVISDEIHFDFLRKNQSHIVYSKVNDYARNNSIICTSPSKTFNIAGLRNSNTVIHNKKIREAYIDFVNKDESGSLKTNVIGMKATEISYNHCEYWIDELNDLIDNNITYVSEFFRKNFPEIGVREPEGTYLMWLDFREINVNPEDLKSYLERNYGLFLGDGCGFGLGGRGFMRMNIAYPRDIIETNLNKLLELARK